MDNNILFKQILNDIKIDNKSTDYERDISICLIDGNKLENNYITLDCGHRFNYISLYNEVFYQKTKKILDNRKLKINEIKCPYCRSVTKKLLPYFKYYEVKDIKGVNLPEEYQISSHVCQYINKNNIKCNNNACITNFGIFCNKHFKYTKKEEEILENIENDFYKNYKKKTIKCLKEELKNKKLKLIGNKDDLINRLYVNIKLKECK